MNKDTIVYTAEVLSVSSQYSLHELSEVSQVPEALVAEFVEYEVIVPDCNVENQFSQQQLNRLCRAARLHRDLELNSSGVALVIELLDTITHLDQKIKYLQKLKTYE